MLSFIMEKVTNDKRSQQMAAVQKEAYDNSFQTEYDFVLDNMKLS